MQDEARRALEAVIMVADQPADPALLLASWSSSAPTPSRRCWSSSPPPTRSRAAASSWPRSPVVGASRAMRTSRPTWSATCSRPDGAPLGCCARDPGDRRLQAADLACPGRCDPRCRCRRCHAHPAAAWLHRRDRQGRRAGTGDAVRHHAAVPGAPGDELARRAAVAGRLRAGRGDVVELLEQGLRVEDEPEPAVAEAVLPPRGTSRCRRFDLGEQPVIDLDAEDDPARERRQPQRRRQRRRSPPRVSGCRRCWPEQGSAAGGCARS